MCTGDGALGPILLESLAIDADGRADLEDAPCDDVHDNTWGTRDYVQVHVRTKFLRSLIACVHIFLGEVSVLLMEGSQ